MQYVQLMDCLAPDSIRRPLIDTAFGLNYSTGTATGPVTAKIASYTILPSEYGKAFSNYLAGTSVTFTLPTAYAGAMLWIVKLTTTQDVVVDGAGSDTINGAATLTNATSEIGGLLLIGISATQWLAFKIGTWA